MLGKVIRDVVIRSNIFSLRALSTKSPPKVVGNFNFKNYAEQFLGNRGNRIRFPELKKMDFLQFERQEIMTPHDEQLKEHLKTAGMTFNTVIRTIVKGLETNTSSGQAHLPTRHASGLYIGRWENPKTTLMERYFIKLFPDGSSDMREAIREEMSAFILSYLGLKDHAAKTQFRLININEKKHPVVIRRFYQGDDFRTLELGASIEDLWEQASYPELAWHFAISQLFCSNLDSVNPGNLISTKQSRLSPDTIVHIDLEAWYHGHEWMTQKAEEKNRLRVKLGEELNLIIKKSLVETDLIKTCKAIYDAYETLADTTENLLDQLETLTPTTQEEKDLHKAVTSFLSHAEYIEHWQYGDAIPWSIEWLNKQKPETFLETMLASQNPFMLAFRNDYLSTTDLCAIEIPIESIMPMIENQKEIASLLFTYGILHEEYWYKEQQSKLSTLEQLISTLEDDKEKILLKQALRQLKESNYRSLKTLLEKLKTLDFSSPIVKACHQKLCELAQNRLNFETMQATDLVSAKEVKDFYSKEGFSVQEKTRLFQVLVENAEECGKRSLRFDEIIGVFSRREN